MVLLVAQWSSFVEIFIFITDSHERVFVDTVNLFNTNRVILKINEEWRICEYEIVLVTAIVVYRKRSSSDALLAPMFTSPPKTAQLSSPRFEQPAVLNRNEASRRSAQSTQTMFNFDSAKRNSLTLISAISNTGLCRIIV